MLSTTSAHDLIPLPTPKTWLIRALNVLLSASVLKNHGMFCYFDFGMRFGTREWLEVGGQKWGAAGVSQRLVFATIQSDLQSSRRAGWFTPQGGV